MIKYISKMMGNHVSDVFVNIRFVFVYLRRVNKLDSSTLIDPVRENHLFSLPSPVVLNLG